MKQYQLEISPDANKAPPTSISIDKSPIAVVCSSGCFPDPGLMIGWLSFHASTAASLASSRVNHLVLSGRAGMAAPIFAKRYKAVIQLSIEIDCVHPTYISLLVSEMPCMTLDVFHPDTTSSHPVHQSQKVNEQVVVFNRLVVRSLEAISKPFRQILCHTCKSID